MKPTAFALLMLLAPPVTFTAAHAELTPYQIQTLLGASEGWRLGPSVVMRWCEKDEPEGVAARRDVFDQWAAAHHEMRDQIEKRFNELVPLVPPAGATPSTAVQAARARITIELSRQSFFGKSQEQVVQYCKAFTSPDFPLWSERRLGIAKAALAELNRYADKSPAPSTPASTPAPTPNNAI